MAKCIPSKYAICVICVIQNTSSKKICLNLKTHSLEMKSSECHPFKSQIRNGNVFSFIHTANHPSNRKNNINISLSPGYFLLSRAERYFFAWLIVVNGWKAMSFCICNSLSYSIECKKWFGLPVWHNFWTNLLCGPTSHRTVVMRKCCCFCLQNKSTENWMWFWCNATCVCHVTMKSMYFARHLTMLYTSSTLLHQPLQLWIV